MGKIFMGLTEIAGYYFNLKQGFDQLGVKSVHIDLSNHPFRYGGPVTNPLVKLLQLTRQKSLASNSSPIFKTIWNILHYLLRIPLFVWTIIQYDVFIFGFNSSFFYFYDLPLLKALSKKIIYVFHGSDSRALYMDGTIMTMNTACSIQDCIAMTFKRKNNLKRIERYADIIIDNPLSAQLHEKKFLVFTILGLPYNLSCPEVSQADLQENSKVRILHSPSHPEAKGTPKIRQTIQKLQAKGHLIEFIEISGRPNAVVLEELAKCDFVVDQLYSDVPMAGFAAEAAFLGKPAIVGSYGLEQFKYIFPPELLPPVHYCHPDELEAAIEKLIIDPAYRLQLGTRARQFVETHWTPKAVAQRFLQAIEGQIEPYWLYDPKNICYLHGIGLPEQRAKAIIRSVIEVGGKEALQLTDKPELEQKFLRFAEAPDV